MNCFVRFSFWLFHLQIDSLTAALCLGKGSLALLQLLCQQVQESVKFDCFRNKSNLCITPVLEGDRGWAVYSLVKETKPLY